MNPLLLALALLPAADPRPMDWTVDGVKRHALVAMPTKPTDHPPLVFGFHGHSGTMQRAANGLFRVHTLWPEAVCVYMQGLPTPSGRDPQGRQPGWQHRPGDHNDRDLKFFDAVLATIKEKHHIDENRVYVMGHSNGGGFTYLLAITRPGTFAAIAPSSCGGFSADRYKPVPVFYVAGEKDQIVSYERQKPQIEALKKANGCDGSATEWAKGCQLFKSTKGTPVVTYIHGGTHAYPREAPELIVKFFKEHARGK
jgi:polyhydroxybutyrate depolymerase